MSILAVILLVAFITQRRLVRWMQKKIRNGSWVIAFLLLSCVSALAQGGSYCTMSTWEPRNLVTKAGLVASYDPGNLATLTSNPAGKAPGSGVSWLSNRVSGVQSDLQQGTAANQPILSRADNCGNLLKQSEDFATTWTRVRVNAFGATDTGGNGAGSFANTSRTLDPAGGHTADFVQEDGTATTTHYILQSYVFNPGVNSAYAWVAPSGRNDVRFGIGDAGSNNSWCYFNVGAGTVGSVANAGSVSAGSGSIVAGPINGFYLCKLTATFSAQLSGSFQILLSSSTPSSSYSGDNTSGLFLWGASLTASSWTPVTGTDAAHGYIATAANPIFPGLGGRNVLYFDGTAHYMKTAAFTLNQPEEVYLGVKQWTWTATRRIFDGNANGSGLLGQYSSGAAPQLTVNAGSSLTAFNGPALGSFGVVRIVFDSTRSRVDTNGVQAVSGDAGLNNMGGYTLGGNPAGGVLANILASRVLICNKTNALAESSYLSWGIKKQAGL